MAKNKKTDETPKTQPKRELVYHPPVSVPDGRYYTTNIGPGSKAPKDSEASLQRYGVTFPVPATEEEAQERYGIGLADLIEEGVKKIATGPNYSEYFDEEGNLLEKGHETMQALADEYRPGQRKPSAKKVDETNWRLAKKLATMLGEEPPAEDADNATKNAFIQRVMSA